MRCQEHNWIPIDWEVEIKRPFKYEKVKGVYFFCSNCEKEMGLYPGEVDKDVLKENKSK